VINLFGGPLVDARDKSPVHVSSRSRNHHYRV
jgi:hypothetical protein